MTKQEKVNVYKTAYVSCSLIKDAWTTKAKKAILMESICEATILDYKDKIEQLEKEINIEEVNNG